MRQPNQPVFLERSTYRRRRMMDAARLLPVLGALLFLVPLLWAPGEDASTTRGVSYVFAIWAGLIVVAGWLSRRLQHPEGDEPPK